MQPLLIIFIVIVTTASCKQHPKSKFDSISATDTSCLNEVKAAKGDIKNGKIVFCYSNGPFNLRCSDEIDSLLNLFGIKYQEVMCSDNIILGQTQGCYCDYMNESIQKKHGLRFTNSLLYIADSIFLQNNINTDTFKFHDVDFEAEYPEGTVKYIDSYIGHFQNDIDRNLHYPRGYVKRPNSDMIAYADVEVFVDKSGRAKTLDYFFLFSIESNYKYKLNLSAQIRRAMKKTDWSAATIRKQKVNSKIVMRIYLE